MIRRLDANAARRSAMDSDSLWSIVRKLGAYATFATAVFVCTAAS